MLDIYLAKSGCKGQRSDLCKIVGTGSWSSETGDFMADPTASCEWRSPAGLSLRQCQNDRALARQSLRRSMRPAAHRGARDFPQGKAPERLRPDAPSGILGSVGDMNMMAAIVLDAEMAIAGNRIGRAWRPTVSIRFELCGPTVHARPAVWEYVRRCASELMPRRSSPGPSQARTARAVLAGWQRRQARKREPETTGTDRDSKDPA